jgi:hypothetical protein
MKGYLLLCWPCPLVHMFTSIYRALFVLLPFDTAIIQDGCACSFAFSHRIVVIPPLCKLLLRYHIMQEKLDKRYHHNIERRLTNI